MKLVFSSDLHGDIPLYRTLAEWVRSETADFLVLGGDLLPSFAPSGRYEDMLPCQRGFGRRFLLPFFRELLRDGPAKGILLIPGNWDLGYSFLFEDPVEGLVDVSLKRHALPNGYVLIGYPFVPPTPFRPKEFEKRDDKDSPWPPQKTPSYIRDPDSDDALLAVDPGPYLRGRTTIGEDLAGLPSPASFAKTICVMHSPPAKTRLDRIAGGQAVGSHAIRAWTEKNQPRIALHGHIHESPLVSGSYADRIGETLAVNPGQCLAEGERPGRLHAVSLEIEAPWETLKHTCLPQG
jgi:uncharacterized protein